MAPVLPTNCAAARSGVLLNAATEVRSRRLTVERVGLHFTDRGKGPVIVVLHGMQDSERTWSRVAATLAQSYRVLALDLPGCGLSDRPDASYSLDWQAGIVAGWLDQLGLDEIDIVGHSYGGGLAMWLLLYRAALIRRMALIAPGGLGREVGLPLRLASLPTIVERFGQPWMGGVTRFMTWLHGSGLTRGERGHLVRVNQTPGSARAFARTVRDVIDWRGQKRHLLDRVAEVSQLPAFAFFWGSRDRIIPVRHGERACTLLANSSLNVLPRLGHFPHWSAPGLLASALMDYFAAPVVARATLSESHISQAATW